MKRLNIALAAALAAVLVLSTSAGAVIGLDPTFGVYGKVTTNFGTNANLSKMVAQADGKIVAVGSAYNGVNNDWEMARYNANGSLDTSFGSGGFVTKDFGNEDFLNAVAIQPDGKIVVGGVSRAVSGNAQWTVARYDSSGTLDPNFGSAGLSTSFPNSIYSSNLLDLVIQPDGKIVANGYTRGPGLIHDDIAAARYNADGSPDVGFGSGGTVTTGIDALAGGTPNDRSSAIALQADGKIVVFGDYDNGNHSDNTVLVRYNIDGTLDNTFDGDGIRTEAYLPHNGGRDVAIQPDGKILVTGSTLRLNFPDTSNTYIGRYNTDGSLDSSFGSGGKVIVSFSSISDGSSSLVLQPDGKILLAGFQQGDSAVRRFNTDGTLDTSFADNGSFVIGLGVAEDGLNSIMLPGDGNILVGGSASNGNYSDWVLARIADADAVINQTSLSSIADTFVQGNQHNTNMGLAPYITVDSGGKNRSLVRFDQSTLQSVVGSHTVVTAKLRLKITDNGNNWGTGGKTIDLNRMLSDWAEGNGMVSGSPSGSGATWNCAIDSDISNGSKDCTGAADWQMGQPNNTSVHPWFETPTSTIGIVDNQNGTVEFDVTADVQNFLNGGATNYGWLLRRTTENQGGMVSFGSKDSLNPPQLVIYYLP